MEGYASYTRLKISCESHFGLTAFHDAVSKGHGSLQTLRLNVSNVITLFFQLNRSEGQITSTNNVRNFSDFKIT